MYRSRKSDHLPLISENPEQAHVRFDSEDKHVEEEYSYSNITNRTEQCREPKQLNVLPVELIQETEQQEQKLESWRQHSAKRSCTTIVYTQRSSTTYVTWIPECNQQPFPRQSFPKRTKTRRKSHELWTSQKRRFLWKCQMQRSISQWNHRITLCESWVVKEDKEGPNCEKTDD